MNKITTPPFILLLEVLLLVIIVSSCETQNIDSIEVLSNWEYRWSEGAWQKCDNFPSVPPGRKGSQILELKSSLPEINSDEWVLWLDRSFTSYQVFVEDVLIGSYGYENDKPAEYFPGFRWNMIPLSPEMSGKSVYFTFWSKTYYIGPQFEIQTGKKSDILINTIMSDLVPTSVSVSFIISGLILLLIALFIRMRVNSALIFSLLLLSVGLYTFRYQHIRFFIIDNPFFWDGLGVWLIFIMPMMCLLLSGSFFSKTSDSVLKISIVVSEIISVFISFIWFFTMLNRHFFWVSDTFYFLVFCRKIGQYYIIALFIVLIRNLIKSTKDGDANAIIFMVGLIILFLSAVPSVLSAFQILVMPVNPYLYLGYFCLFICIGMIIINKHTRLQSAYFEAVSDLRSIREEEKSDYGNNVYEKKIKTETIKKFGITNRELDVIEISLLGKRNKEIAEILGISERTVKSHITNIFNKTDVKNKLELIHVLST